LAESFGARLRTRREQQHISLDAIVDATKIKLSLLEGLERDDVSRWPSGIFRRGYMRAYAHAVGLNPDDVLREFLALYPEPEEALPSADAVARDGDASRGRGMRRFVSSALAQMTRRTAAVADTTTLIDRESPAGPQVELPEPVRTKAASADAIEQPAESAVEPSAARREPSLASVASVCTRLAQLETVVDLTLLLDETVGSLGAVGLIVWAWHPDTEQLTPLLSSGYSPKVVAQLPTLARDDDNATAEAFRSGQMTTVGSTERSNGALVAPLMRSFGCVGVLAIELVPGAERDPSVSALAAILAAQLATMVDIPSAAAALDRKLA
jgi:transcriptional regulator with XRE-family HTH domain